MTRVTLLSDMDVNDAMDLEETLRVEDHTIRSPLGQRQAANGHESQLSLPAGGDAKPGMLFRCFKISPLTA